MKKILLALLLIGNIAFGQVDSTKIVFMGSSVCLGQGAVNKKGYAYTYSLQLGERANLGSPKFYSTNISIGGTNTIVTLDRFDSDLLPQKGKYVVFGLSLGNEGIKENDKDSIVSQFANNLDSLVQKAISNGYTPVVANCYTRNDFTASEYEYSQKMNSIIHKYSIPSINLLGAVDDGNGRFVSGYWDDAYHPNDAGFDEMYRTIVPSLFDALSQNKLTPKKIEGSFITLNNNSNAVIFNPEDSVHSFTSSVSVKSNNSGTILSLEHANGVKNVEINNEGYVAINNNEIIGVTPIKDNNWHMITVTHYYAKGITQVYVDSVLQGSINEKILLSNIILGSSTLLKNVQYRDWCFYRAGMNDYEIREMSRGEMLKSSLELYAPLDGQLVTLEDSLHNIAQSTNILLSKVNLDIHTYNFTTTPSQFVNNKDTELQVSFQSENSENILKVEIDFSIFDGGQRETMQLIESTYEVSSIINSGINEGTYLIPIEITDIHQNVLNKYVSVQIIDTITELILYSDYNTEVCPNCIWSDNGEIIEDSNDSLCEGSKAIKFDYNVQSYWAGIGINLTGWDDTYALDFSKYDTLVITYKGPYGAGKGINAKLVVVDELKPAGFESKAYILKVDLECNTIKIPLTYFDDVDLTKVKAINFTVSGVSSGEGYFFIDNIKLEGKLLADNTDTPTDTITVLNKIRTLEPYVLYRKQNKQVLVGNIDGYWRLNLYSFNGSFIRTIEGKDNSEININLIVPCIAVLQQKNKTYSFNLM